jgi:hypothetical protein
MNANTPMQRLRMLAVDLLIDRHIGADQLIQAGLDALLAGIDLPSLARLAGLTRAEEPQARQLFDDTAVELDLVPPLPPEPHAKRWALVHWWAELIVNGDLDPATGGHLIWHEGWNKLNYPSTLQPLVGWTSEYDDWTSNWDIPRDTYLDHIIEEARNLLRRPW